MRRGVMALVILVCLALTQLNFTSSKSAVPATRAYVLAELEALIHSIDQLETSTNPDRKKLYHEAREHYKHIEFFIEFFSTREAKYYLNGPLVPKHDQENGATVIYPNGFQKIEEQLFSDEQLDFGSFSKTVRELSAHLKNIQEYYQSVKVSDNQLLEMAQLQLHRIASLTLNGYDATLTLQNVKEAYWNFEGLEQLFNGFEIPAEKSAELAAIHQRIIHKLEKGKRFLKSNQNYEKFDRLGFIVEFIDPLNNDIIDFHNAAGIPWSAKKQALALRKKGLFTEESFDRRYFSMYFYDTLGLTEQIELGRTLFFDPVLSGNNERSCASCHKPDQAFADQLKGSQAFNRESSLDRNTPSLLNVMYQHSFFHDGRVEQLEEQVRQVIHNQNEMGSSLENCAEKLVQSDEYKSLFKAAFNTDKISAYHIQKAITEYEKTLISFNSRFDQFLKGDKKTITKREHNGYNLFAGKALCGSCHFFPVFNGTVPPFYADSEFEVIGTPESAENKKLSPDMGRFKVTGLKEQVHAFKTPTVRNVEHTAPYMHNGVYSKLEEVVDFYHKGGGKAFGYPVENQTLPFDSLQLSPTEKQDLVLFMKCLSDKGSQYKAPLSLPAFPNNTALNKRKVGGVY